MGSSLGAGSSRSPFGRALATRGASSDAKGSSAPAGRLLLTLALASLVVLLLAPPAHAGKVPGFGILGTGLTGTGGGLLGTSPQGVAVNTTGAGGAGVGDVYVSDATNNRVSQYSGSGAFIRTWGWDVTASGEHNTGTNEQQNVTVKATGGNFTLTVTTAVNGRGAVTTGSKLITNVEPTQGTFHVGDVITGTGIPATPATTITAVGASTLNISANATANNAAVTNLSAKETTANISATAEASQVKAALEAKEGVGTVEVTGGPGNATGTAPYQVTFTAGPLSHNDITQMTATGVALTGGSPSSSVAVTTAVVGGGFEICQVASSPTDVCQIGVASSAAGGIAGAQGLGVSPATGTVYLASNTSKRINAYSATGQFQGAFGWNVNATTPEAKLQFCTTATGCLAGSSGGGAGQFDTLSGSNGAAGAAPAVSPVNGHLFVPEPGNRRVSEFSFTFAGNEVSGVAFVKAFGGDVAPTINEQQTVTLSGATGGTFALGFNSKSTDGAGTGDLEAGSNEVTNFQAAAGSFVVGQELSGPGIPAGAKITAATFDSLTLTAAATATTNAASVSSALPFDAGAATVRDALAALSTIGTGNVAASGANGGPWTVEFKGSLAGTDVGQLTGDAADLTGSTPSVDIATTQVGANGASLGLESCTVATTCKAGGGKTDPVSAQYLGEVGTFSPGTPASLAIDSTGGIYATGAPSSATCSPTCRIQKFNPAATAAEEFVPGMLTTPELADAGSSAPRLVAVDPSNDHVLVVKKISSSTSKIYEFTRAGSFIDSSPPGSAGFAGNINPALTNGPQGLAVGTSGRAYLSLVGTPPLGTPVKILGNPPAPKTAVEAPTGVGQTSATLTGVAEPAPPGIEGGFATVAFFEYSSDGVSWTATDPVEIGTGTGAGNPNSCPTGNPPTCNMSTLVGGLKAGTTYLVRLVASNGTKATSSTTSFTTTDSGPGIKGLGASDVTQSSASLNGEIEPNGKTTSYHFEWGPTTSYGTRVPADFEAVAGGGSQPIPVSIQVSGLQPNTTYHFRIVAKSSSGTTVSADQAVLTLNGAGLPSNRGIELVSPVNKRPVGGASQFFGTQEYFQAAEAGGAIAYPVFNGLEDSTAGGVLLYRGSRSSSAWASAQISPPSLVPSPNAGTDFADIPSSVRYFSPDLGCGLVETPNPVTADTPEVDVANGVTNLYRWNASDGSFTLITKQPPLDPTLKPENLKAYEVAGSTPDCSRVFFRSTTYAFAGNSTGLYEWDNGTLRDAGLRPDDTVPPGSVGAKVAVNKYTVSRDGRFFFVATSNEAGDSGKAAIFVRKSPTEVVNASKPIAGSPNASLGASYEGASADGSHVFFLANYGIAATSVSTVSENCSSITEPGTVACDLYDYNVNTETLTDVSADTNPADPKGAVVQGVLDISGNGSTVYFAARGQLVPGEGRTYAQNLSGAGSANIYRSQGGELSYVGLLDAESLVGANQVNARSGALIHAPEGWTSQTTENGDHLLFTSKVNMTGTNPKEVRQAYLYSAAEGTTECVSCPKGRLPHPAGPRVIQSMMGSGGGGFMRHNPRSLSEDGRVFFASEEALTPDAVEGKGTGGFVSGEGNIYRGENNIYEWNRGQVSLLTSGRVEMIDLGGANAEDVYVRSYEQLVPQDIDFASDIYDIRVGGRPVSGDADQDAGRSHSAERQAEQSRQPTAAKAEAQMPQGQGAEARQMREEEAEEAGK